jgi:phage terminase Nu1 subunit (DNA packaging protein)
MAKSNTVSLSEFAQFVGIERKTLQKYIDEEGMPTVFRGTKGKAAQLDSVDCVHWYMARDSGEGSAMELARLGKTQEEERKLSIENDTKMGQLCPVEDVVVLYSETLVIIRSSLEGLPGRLAGGNKALRQKWLNEIRTTLNSAADGVQQFIQSSVAPSSSDESAGGSSELEVGEGKKSPAKRRSRAGAVSTGKDPVGNRNKRSVPPAADKKRNSSPRKTNVKNRGGAV